jgi:translation initiation factor 5A
MSEDHDFESGTAGAAESIPVQASSLRKSGFVLIKGHPCKIVDMSSSKTGKHGHAKIHFVALDIFDGKKYEDICPSTHNMQQPIVNRKECQALGIDEDNFVDITDDGEDKTIKADPEFVKDINKYIDEDGSCQVTVLTSMGREKIITVKQDQP